MNNKTVSRLFVGSQFVVLIALVLIPGETGAWGAQSELFRGIGIALVLAGFAIEFISARNLGRSLTPSPIPREDSTFVTTGIYKLVRHPIYTGLFVAGAGLVLQRGWMPHLFLEVALVVLLTVKARWEEGFLQARYPEYKAYMAKTGMFLPRLNG